MESLNQYSPDVRDMFASRSCLFLMDREASLGIDDCHLNLADERLSLDEVVESAWLSSTQPYGEVYDEEVA